jgi:hypothetical protein
MEMQETMRSAIPIDVGGILRRIVGAREAVERMNRVKFKHERRRFGKEHELLSLEEAIFGSDALMLELLEMGFAQEVLNE